MQFAWQLHIVHKTAKSAHKRIVLPAVGRRFVSSRTRQGAFVHRPHWTKGPVKRQAK
jgi:hypothetical protein